MEINEVSSNANEVIPGTAIKSEKDGQPVGFSAASTEFQEMPVKIERLQSLPAEIERSNMAPVMLIPQTHECLKAELILEDELSFEASHAQNHSQDLLGISEYHQAKVSTAVETKTCKSRRRTPKKVFRESILCEFCPLSFKNADSLRRHMVSHDKDKERTFPCQSCGKVFVSKGNLVTHMNTHTGDPGHCGVCGNHNTQKHNVRAHIKYMLWEHSVEKRRNASAPKTSNEYSEYKSQQSTGPQVSNEASVSSEDDLQYICGLDSTSDASTFGPITSNDVSVQSEDNLQYTSGLQISNDASRDYEHKAHYSSGFHISYEGFVHSENTHQSTSGPVPSNDASVHTKGELMSDEEFLDEDKGPSAQDEQRTSASIAESQTPNDASVHPTIELMSDEDLLDEDKGPNEAQVSLKSDLLKEHEQRTSANIVHPKSSNEFPVHPTIELMSDEESLDEESLANSAQKNAPSDLFAEDEQGTSASIAESQTPNDVSVHTKIELMSDEEFLDEDKVPSANCVQIETESASAGVEKESAASAQGNEQSVEVSMPPDSVTCELCRKIYPKVAFSTHMRMAHCNKAFKCKMCPRSFLFQDLLNQHMATHEQKVPHNEKQFPCQTCGQTFSALPVLNNHRRIHDTRTYECSVCGVAFKQKRSRNWHMLRRHPCEAQQSVRKAPTANPDSVQTKTELATDEEFWEEDAGVESTQRSQQSSSISLAADSVSCEVCHKSYPKEVFNTHVRLEHRERRRSKCELCPYSFLNLKTHMLTHAKDRKKCP